MEGQGRRFCVYYVQSAITYPLHIHPHTFTPLTMLMHKAKTLQYLVHNVPYSCLWEGLCAMLYHFIKVLLHVFKDKVEFVVLTDHLTEPDNVGMLQLH